MMTQRRRKPGGRRFFPRRKVCQFCVDKSVIDYKDAQKIRRLISDWGKVDSRRRTSTCAPHQRQLSLAIKRARFLALLPYSGSHSLMELARPDRGDRGRRPFRGDGPPRDIAPPPPLGQMPDIAPPVDAPATTDAPAATAEAEAEPASAPDAAPEAEAEPAPVGEAGSAPEAEAESAPEAEAEPVAEPAAEPEAASDQADAEDDGAGEAKTEA